MTVTGYPPTDQEIQTMSDAEAEKAFAKHFAAPVPDYSTAIMGADLAAIELKEIATLLENAAKAVYGTTPGNKLIVQAAEIRDGIRYLEKTAEEMKKCRKQEATNTVT